MANKTVIQGLEPADAPQAPVNYGASVNNPVGATRQTAPVHGTVVPGMEGGYQAPAAAAPAARVQRPVATGKPVIGFLYSISRTAAGEYWPLHVGQNVIGKSPSCDVVLQEGTVSEEHAVLMIRKMKNPESVIASITDARSTNGTMLNGESLPFTAVDCKNGDIITIGDNYELFLVLIDVAALGLKVCPNFIAVEQEAEPEEPAIPAFEPGATRPGQGYDAFGGPTPPPFGGYAGGTVGLDGSTPSGNKGGTIGM